MSEPLDAHPGYLAASSSGDGSGDEVLPPTGQPVDEYRNAAPDYQGGPPPGMPRPRRQDHPYNPQRPRPPPSMNRPPPSQWPLPETDDGRPPPIRPRNDERPPRQGDPHGYGRRPPPRGPPRHPPPGPHYRPPPHLDPRYRQPSQANPPYHPIPRPPPHSRFNNYPPQYRARPSPSRPPQQDPRYSGYSMSQNSRASSAQQSPNLSHNSASGFGEMAPPPRNPQRLGPRPGQASIPRFAPGYGKADGEEGDSQSDRQSSARSVDGESFEFADFYGSDSNRGSAVDSDNVPKENNRDSGLVRSASLGKSMKPAMTTIGNGDHQVENEDSEVTSPPTPVTPEVWVSEPMIPEPPTILEPEDQSPPRSQPEPVMGGTVESGKSPDANNRASGLARLFKSGVGLLRPQSSTETMTNLRPSSQDSFNQNHGDGGPSTSPKSPSSPKSTYLTPQGQSQSQFFASESRRSSGINNDTSNAGAGLASSTGEKVGSRPGLLTVDAAKEKELRASTTSLQGLIQRSLRLASNLERGKTSSKFGLDWMTSDSPTRPTVTTRQSSGSLNGILKNNSPHADQYDEKDLAQSGLRQVENNSRSTSKDAGKRCGRRCCGMPLWAFIFTLVCIFLLVLAAVLIPVFLIVVPDHDNSNGTSSTATGNCTSPLSCANGGTNAPGASGMCECICANGFAGTTCTEQTTDGCVTTNIGDNSNVQIGSAIPAVLDGAQSNYDISLNGSAIYGLFQNAHVSCTGQNALVTFNGLTQRSIGTPALSPRQSYTADSGTLGFARTAVLYIGQTSESTQTAMSAQSSLQAFLTKPAGQSAQQVVVGAGWVVDLISWTVSGGGAVVGGNGT